MRERERIVRDLYRQRPRSRMVRLSAGLLLGLGVTSWWLGDFQIGSLFTAQKASNLRRFLGEVVPRPLRGEPFDFGVWWQWAGAILDTKGWSATWTTLAISVAAIVLAGLGSLVLCVPAARNFATPEPFAPAGRLPGRARRAAWRAVVVLTRLLLVFLRAIPEYIWAFLLLAVFGPTSWPAVLALAIHNLGILGKLNAETIENVESGPLRALAGLGARRRQIAAVAAFPAVLPRLLLYFFYRWETCVREATVLGMLGIVSLGYYIKFDARPKGRYDEMVFLILLGAAIVIVGDFASAVARRIVRRAG
ncbi:MAG: PhnE/PtxC family ABC transporter permease [Planctomycetota bacterium]|jgi:phosphonate transport system permease protein